MPNEQQVLNSNALQLINVKCHVGHPEWRQRFIQMLLFID